MPMKITAIELENFQSIERRTRIDFKPITLLFGPNSAGKSSVFDALELLRTLLDPTRFDEHKAAELVNRWARNKEKAPSRETFLAVEFPFEAADPYDIWSKEGNWTESMHRTESPSFGGAIGWDPDDPTEFQSLKGKTVRIELRLKVISRKRELKCRLSEFALTAGGRPILTLSRKHPSNPAQEALSDDDDDDVFWWRWLSIHDDLGLVSGSVMDALTRAEDSRVKKFARTRGEMGDCFHAQVQSLSLSPMKLVPDSISELDLKGAPGWICRNASDLMFYFGTQLWAPMRSEPGVVVSDRRAPKPDEALALVDLGLSGWWSKGTFSPSSPAALLISGASVKDEHFQGLAEVAYAELLLRTASDDFWGGGHAAKNLEPVRARARILERVNHHLDKSLFREKLYKLSCAATLMVPIDLSEDDPWSYYALAQPAVVRLFLQDESGQQVELQDVGSGIPFVLPILYATSCQGFVKVQQPELHLHPALQSSVADIFVEELNRSGAGQFLIETHSEHLLLRLLRRIRDQEKGKCLSQEMRLTNKEVAVYYFDPQVGGETVVTQQLVTPLGDFFTDWPRGFFAERDRDLFDE